MAHEPIPVTDAEATVMEVLWQSSPRSSEDVVAAVAPATGWAEPTIKTLLNRLLNKGAISAEREGRRYLYSPVLSREAWVEQQSEGLLARLFGGRVAPLVAHFSERGRLSATDIAELKRLVSRLEEGGDDGR
ncbi:BlaI/MecI/CopY family transcriptional regulator [Pseudoxanthomonas sp. SGNA-20]|jgi:Predicted transcriptional regulator|uniref:Putative transcriptional regulator n=1 Tax=Pseudoxanthomonas taiwanensis J19 TaxID=935569 RepID=A0A562E4Q7_9GAMM|nr:BlaI/MecI/CopY family transcriptional regulator [Pseudoxanthomonas sp. SGNA-20]RRN80724.1 BlaI/MecI/CopY family transcriptional regulator [Pseudoxanthomonas sp. SGD-10]TWH16810.1 putative transcriptional regulator [Pseudoxanthomonas taiwanensis J19]